MARIAVVPRPRRVVTAAGLSVAVRGEGAPLVAVHGFGTHGGAWDALAAGLGQWRLWRPDLPGFGASAAPAASWDAAAVGAELAALAGRAAWIGWSLGGLVAMHAALAAPARVERLVLLGATPCFVARHGEWDCGMDAGEFAAFRAGAAADPRRTAARFLALCMHGDERRGEGLRALRAAAGDAPVPQAASLLAALDVLEHSDVRARVAALGCPVLVVHGANDAVVPVCAAAALARALPRAELVVVPGAGHAPQVSHPHEVAAIVRRFLGGSGEDEEVGAED